MTKLEKQFLDCCINNFAENSIIGSDNLLPHLNVPLSKLERCAEHLEQKGYIKNLHIHKRLRFCFQLTYAGISYKEIRYENIKDFLLKSIFVPIAISVIASLIVSAVGYLWSMESISRNSHLPTETPANELNIETNGSNQE